MTVETIPWREADRLANVRFQPVRFTDIAINARRQYLVKGLAPRVGLTVIWGPPKCGKSFFAFDLVMHVALGWEYRTRKVTSGPVCYIACEGADGFKARVEAFRQHRLADDHDGDVPFYLVGASLNLIAEHGQLIADIKATMADELPIVVVIDTLNRSLAGSESSDEDMSAYVRAADAIRDAFRCAVVVVHHCGVDATRPRGHTSLTGAADAQIAVKREPGGIVSAKVEWMKDGPDGDEIHSRLEQVEVGTDEDGDPITSCVIVEADQPAEAASGPRLSKNQTTMFAILKDAGPLPMEEWNRRCREAGLGNSRKADLTDARMAMKVKGLVYEFDEKWHAN